jgi:predicted ATPase
MRIKDIRISNFKSFKDAHIEKLGSFNVIIGTNASGKSNFIQVFRFLRDIANHGLENAVSLQGGGEYLANSRLDSSEPLRLKITYTVDMVIIRKNVGIRIDEAVYEFAVRFRNRGSSVTVIKDSLSKRLTFFSLPPGSKTISEGKVIGDGSSVLFNQKGKIDYKLERPESVVLAAEDIIPDFLKEERLPENTLLLETPYFEFIHYFEKFFDKLAIYDFDPNLPKKSISITGKRDLEEDGSKLALTLRAITSDKEKKRKFTNLIRGCLPFVEDLDVEKLADGSLLFKIWDAYAGNAYMPATFVSDGTVNIAALIIALFFEEKSLVILEEPEKNVHPYLIGRMVEMMKDASRNKQIFVTTHNPEIVKCADMENIVLIARNREGFSTVTKPAEREEVKTFLESEIGIEDLYIQNLLDQDQNNES